MNFFGKQIYISGRSMHSENILIYLKINFLLEPLGQFQPKIVDCINKQKLQNRRGGGGGDPGVIEYLGITGTCFIHGPPLLIKPLFY